MYLDIYIISIFTMQILLLYVSFDTYQFRLLLNSSIEMNLEFVCDTQSANIAKIVTHERQHV